MERYKRAIDFIMFVRNLHSDFKNYFEKILDNQNQEKIKMILGYLAEHESKMVQTLNEYVKGLAKSIEETWYQFIELPKKPTCLKNLSFKGDMSIDSVLELISKMDNCLINLYKKLSEISVTDETRKIFQNLADLEKNELRRVVHNIQKAAEL